jgi:hypothetical protein
LNESAGFMSRGALEIREASFDLRQCSIEHLNMEHSCMLSPRRLQYVVSTDPFLFLDAIA